VRALTSILVAGLAAACASVPHLHYDPALLSTEVCASGVAPGARAVLVWRGFRERDVPELTFRLRLENTASAPLDLAPAVIELFDGTGTSVAVASTAGRPPRIDAGSSAVLELSFPVALPRKLAELDLQDLTVRVQLLDGRWSWEAHFPHDDRADDPTWCYRETPAFPGPALRG